jgi:hypothetical protein
MYIIIYHLRAPRYAISAKGTMVAMMNDQWRMNNDGKEQLMENEQSVEK